MGIPDHMYTEQHTEEVDLFDTKISAHLSTDNSVRLDIFQAVTYFYTEVRNVNTYPPPLTYE